MLPRTWFVGALLVALAGVAQPIIILDPFLTGTLLAAGGAAALLGAATIGAGAVGAGVIGAGAIGAAKVGAVGAGALKAAAVGAGTVGLAKVGLGTVVHSGFQSGLRSSLNNQHSNGGSYRSTFTSSYSSRRHRRAIRPLNGAQEMLVTEAFALDQEKPCGLRLVCELAIKGADELETDELLMMALLNQPHSLSSNVVPYQKAANLGRTSTTSTVCTEAYGRCKLDRFQIMQLLRQTYGV